VVLVAGGVGAVGNAAIQLARWAGATVLARVSSPQKAALAKAAGAHVVINYRTDDALAAIRQTAAYGVDIMVEIAPSANAVLNGATTAVGGTVAVYAIDGPGDLALPVWPLMHKKCDRPFHDRPDGRRRRRRAPVHLRRAYRRHAQQGHFLRRRRRHGALPRATCGRVHSATPPGTYSACGSAARATDARESQRRRDPGGKATGSMHFLDTDHDPAG